MKKLTCTLAFLAVLFCAFAQKVESVGLKDSDVKNYIKNFDTIQKEAEAFGDMSEAQILLEMQKAESSGYNPVEKILERNGISGPNSTAKIYAIAQCYAVLLIEEEMNKDKETAKMYKEMGINPVEMYMQQVNEADCKTVKKHYKDLKKVFGD